MKKVFYKRNENSKAVSVLDTIPQEPLPKLKNEWERGDFNKVQLAIARHFNDTEIKTLHGNYRPLSHSYGWYTEKFGLPYTSCGTYAALWVTNTEVYSNEHPGYHYEGFALGEDGTPYAVLQDKDENVILVTL